MTATGSRHAELPVGGAERLTLFGADRPLRLECGRVLTDVPVVFERYGPRGAETVFVCHALTGDAHVARHGRGDAPGWWESMVGPGRPIDTDRFQVICANVLGGCSGTLGPSPADRDAVGEPFPQITVADMVAVHRELLRRLGVGRLHAVVGGSLGGMQALEWLLRHPYDAHRFGLIATSARLSTDNLAFNAIGRAAIRSDPRFLDGAYRPGEGPDAGLGIARMIGHLTYMSGDSLQTKFARQVSGPPHPGPGTTRTAGVPAWGPFSVERYLEHQAEKLVARFDANSYLCLTSAMDLFDAFATPCEQVAEAAPDVRLFSFASDRLYGVEHSRHIADRLQKAGVGAAHFHEETSGAGHDAFLMEVPGYLDAVAGWLASPLRGETRVESSVRPLDLSPRPGPGQGAQQPRSDHDIDA
ncbi:MULTISPECIES: homoserine O-acetyltransferase [Streptomyces]|uniref:Homoserine O-acetyltransferase n=1 Tax=Streptomyces doudnae TaxID=3075536 RepID=A0ABD5EXR9_9ACTN|nr:MULTISPECIES: homoserine O-acetyltransferase [unclassified Streptomyces]MDT0439110.1 homoserine O-acetyltransferase [Streptomyces sp. DSM 41981]MYQ67356.1 homoserine O-acetyltransferase [Streptomyces sp. SID4950]SCE33698.1 homoserine O-acetyltransferase [Streptomyces sp. SolWspMP-5a-2]